jgi:hypothetical protein
LPSLSSVGATAFAPRYLSSKLSYDAAALISLVAALLALVAAFDALVDALLADVEALLA